MNYHELRSCAVSGRYRVCLYFSWKVKISWESVWVLLTTLEHPDSARNSCVCPVHLQHSWRSSLKKWIKMSFFSSLFISPFKYSWRKSIWLSVVVLCKLLIFVTTYWISVLPLMEKKGLWYSRTCWKLSGHNYLGIGWNLMNLSIDGFVLWLNHLTTDWITMSHVKFTLSVNCWHSPLTWPCISDQYFMMAQNEK